MLLRNPRLKPRPGARLNPHHWAGRPTLKYLFNEGGGTLRDLSGGGNTGTPAGGATWTPNASGLTLKFNGSSGQVTAAKSNTVQGGACWLTCYVQFTSVGGSLARFLAGQQDSGGQYSCGLIDYDGEVSRGLRFWVKSSSGQSFAETAAVNWASANKTYRLDGTWDGANIRLYVNGLPNGAGGTLSGGSIVASNPFMLAFDALASGQGVGGKRYLNGFISGVAAYPFAPTAAQVWRLYQRPYDMIFERSPRRGFAGLGAILPGGSRGYIGGAVGSMI
jgi:hypothetical protein